MLALSWLYCAVPALGNGRRTLLGLVLCLSLRPDLVELLLRDHPAADRGDGAGGDLDLVAATRGEQRRQDQDEKGHTHDELLHRFSLPEVDDRS